MKPTVGRLVYYKSYGTPNGEYKPEDRAAIITGVVDETTVHLCVINPTGMLFNLNVKQGNAGGQWDWMPYQKGQAAKTEELEKLFVTRRGAADDPLGSIEQQRIYGKVYRNDGDSGIRSTF